MRPIKALLFAWAVVLFAAIGFGPELIQSANGGGEPGSGIEGSKHDFRALPGNIGQVGTCTFCHLFKSSPNGDSLVWNHALSHNNFRWDVPETTAGTTYPVFSGQTYSGPTAKCLSCHDGTVAIGHVLADANGNEAILNNTFVTGPSRVVSMTGIMNGNHPVAIPYPYMGIQNFYNGVRTGGGAVPEHWRAEPLPPIRLYHDAGIGQIDAGPIAGRSGIECSSCHDAHNKISLDHPMLLGRLTGSGTDYLCGKCHLK